MPRISDSEMTKLKLANTELELENRHLKEAVTMLEKELKLSNKLLRKQRIPRRPYCNSTSKALIAAQQGFKCYGVEGFACPLLLTNKGVFDCSLWEVDHIKEYSKYAPERGFIFACI